MSDKRRYEYDVLNDEDVFYLKGEVKDRRRKHWIVELTEAEAAFIQKAMGNYDRAQMILWKAMGGDVHEDELHLLQIPAKGTDG